MDTTEEQRKEYQSIRDQFHQKRRMLQALISSSEGTISTRQRAISNLERQIREARPRIKGANKLCQKCDIVSMKYSYMQIGPHGREQWYECMVCNYKDSHF